MPNSENERVLLVEDSKSFSSILSKLIFETHGFYVDIAESLAETEHIIRDHGQRYFAAVVDYHLPDAPQGEAIDIVANAGIPTIIFTGSPKKSLEEDLWAKNIADYANKFGAYNLEYVTWMVKRLYCNRKVEVLVVDDSLAARQVISAMLYRQNFKVRLAESGEAAMKLLHEHSSIRIAVIDCNMGGINGFELASQIREDYSRAKLEIIGVSSQIGRNLAAQFIKAGASDFVLKPLIPEEFLCRVNTAADRIESYCELDRLNKLKNQFIGTAAHDIRGPVGSIKTAADYLLKRQLSPERREKLITMIQSSSSGLLDLLETLLDITVIESGKPQLERSQINVSEALKERIDLYQSEAASKGLVIRQSIASGIEAFVDPVKVKQIFDNLITNAIKYSEPHTEVAINLIQNDKALLLSIKDSGPGIEAEERNRLFKAYSVLSTKATGGEKKTGLGLAIAKNIVDAHEGKIYYRNDEQTHSTFFVELPLQA